MSLYPHYPNPIWGLEGEGGYSGVSATTSSPQGSILCSACVLHAYLQQVITIMYKVLHNMGAAHRRERDSVQGGRIHDVLSRCS